VWVWVLVGVRVLSPSPHRRTAYVHDWVSGVVDVEEGAGAAQLSSAQLGQVGRNSWRPIAFRGQSQRESVS